MMEWRTRKEDELEDKQDELEDKRENVEDKRGNVEDKQGDETSSLPDETSSLPARVWHRTRLPHFEGGEIPQHITFHLADSMPKEVLAQWEMELQHLPLNVIETERRSRYQAYLDAGVGC